MKYSWIAVVFFPILLIIYSFEIPQLNFSSGGTLPATYNDLFAGSGTCLLCHNSQVNQAGESISIIADWRSTMMANAARDPFWRAKVSHEGLVNPGHKDELEDVCSRCHAPTGNINAHHNGQQLYSIEEMQNDPLAMDGVQCTVCHQIKEESLGNFSGTFEIGDQKIIYGPYQDPFTNPMVNNIGYTPEYSVHINNSRMCGSCHTLITNSVDNNGQPTGNEFVEQSIYQEWENSDYPSYNTSCSSCHVPRISEPVVISTMPPWLEGRSPFGMHHFQGANVLITTMLKDYADELGVTASSEQYNTTIARNIESLQEHTLEFNLQELNRTADTLFIDLQLINKSGHKFPTGYPSRRFFIEIIVADANNQAMFHSGAMDNDYQIINEDDAYEYHYDIINSEDQVQIYEMVMGDINHEVTTVLERANFHLKDNRIPPTGFMTSHFAYDTVSIVGIAEDDPDFNFMDNIEGSGSDILHFHIPTNGYLQMLKIKVKLHYQSVSSKWLEHMFTYSSTEINAFKGYYEAADKSPVLIASDSTVSMYESVEENINDRISIFPNPAKSNITLHAIGLTVEDIAIYDSQGRELEHINKTQASEDVVVMELNYPRGLYFIKVVTDKGRFTKKVVLR
ncbi:MAG: T9SS type A sorting domain-containing protein [Bacteroidota bacterium]